MKRIINDYFTLVRAEHLKYDLGISVLLVGVIITLSVYYNIGIEILFKELTQTISTIIAAFSILSGFNIASLSIFSTSKSSIAEKLRTEKIKDTDRAKIEQILSYFSWSILIQLTSLLIAIVLPIIYSVLPMEEFAANSLFKCLLWLSFSIILVLILYSIHLTMRNVWILYHYLVAEARTNENK